jgi:hypothetical protein
VIENLAKASKVLGQSNTSACVCITPKTVHYLREDVENIRKKTGTRIITIEPIIELESWSFENVAVFVEQVRLLCEDLKNSVKMGDPFFLNSLCWYLHGGGRRQKMTNRAGYDQCPFLGSVDVSPSGDIAFSPFALYGKKEKRGVIGNVTQVQGAWWQTCHFERESATCLDCYAKYYAFGGLTDKSRHLMSYMDALIDETVRFLQAASSTDKRYGQYIEEAKTYAS